MINRKPFLFVLFTLATLLFLGCDSQESLVFEKQRITAQILPECHNSMCAAIEINMMRCLLDSERAKRINQEIEKIACQILHITEDKPQQTLEDAIKEFNSFYWEMRSEFPEETVPYEVGIDSEISFRNKEIISMLVDFYTFTGGAHGYGAVTFINLDTKSGKPLPTTALLKEYESFKKYVEKKFRKKFRIAATLPINSTGFFFENDQFTLPENLGFSAEEVILIFNQYDIDAYAEEPVELKILKSEVASFFKLDIL